MYNNKILSLPEGWEILSLSPEKLSNLYGKIKKDYFFKSLSKDEILKSLFTFTSIPLISEKGFILLSNIHPQDKAVIKIIPFLHLSKKEIKDIIYWIFIELDLYRLEYYTFPFLKGENRFVERSLGFRYEGLLRKVLKKKEKRYNLKLYSLLRDELGG